MPDEPTDDMTSPPSEGDDELLHAYLDDEASADERALVEADPALLARLEAVRALRSDVRAALAAPVPEGATGREMRLAAALDAMSTADAEAEAPLGAAALAAPATVTALDEARTRRSHRARLGAWLGAAAVVLVGLVAVGSALRDRDHGSESGSGVPTAGDAAGTKAAPANPEVATAPDRNTQTYNQDQSGGAAATATTGATPGPAASETTVAAGATAGPTSTTAIAPTGDNAAQQAVPLAALDTTDDLRRFVAAHEQATPSTLAAPCAGRFGPSIGEVTWRGVPAVVVVQPDVSAPVRALVVDGGCAVIASVDVP